jgi:hypothetical protein
MVGVVQADADQFASARHTGAKAQVYLRLTGHQGQGGQVKLPEAIKLRGKQYPTADVIHQSGEVTHTAVDVERTGFFQACWSKTQ